MTIEVQILQDDMMVARVFYNPGFLVEIKIEKTFRTVALPHGYLYSEEPSRPVSWQEALDKFFNETIFEAHKDLMSNGAARTGSAREHRNLFLTATRFLEKELSPHGFSFRLSFG